MHHCDVIHEQLTIKYLHLTFESRGNPSVGL